MAWYRVKFEYKAVEPTELTVPGQAVVRILSSEHPEWWLADWNGVQGFLPFSYVEPLPDWEAAQEQARYDATVAQATAMAMAMTAAHQQQGQGAAGYDPMQMGLPAGAYCEAFWEEDQDWFSAQINEPHYDRYEYTVTFTEYGNSATLPCTYVRPPAAAAAAAPAPAAAGGAYAGAGPFVPTPPAGPPDAGGGKSDSGKNKKGLFGRLFSKDKGSADTGGARRRSSASGPGGDRQRGSSHASAHGSTAGDDSDDDDPATRKKSGSVASKDAGFTDQHNTFSSFASSDPKRMVEEIDSRFEGGSAKLLSPGRRVVGRGILGKICRFKVVDYYFFLFNDLLVYAEAAKDGRYKLHQRIPIDTTFSVQVLPDVPGERPLRFLIGSATKQFVVFALSPQERDGWVEDIRKCIAEARGLPAPASVVPVTTIGANSPDKVLTPRNTPGHTPAPALGQLPRALSEQTVNHGGASPGGGSTSPGLKVMPQSVASKYEAEARARLAKGPVLRVASSSGLSPSGAPAAIMPALRTASAGTPSPTAAGAASPRVGTVTAAGAAAAASSAGKAGAAGVDMSVLSRAVATWNVKDVASWLHLVEFDEYADSFVRNKVDGLLLLTLAEGDLEKELGMDKPLHRKRLIQRLEQLRKQEKEQQDHKQMNPGKGGDSSTGSTLVADDEPEGPGPAPDRRESQAEGSPSPVAVKQPVNASASGGASVVSPSGVLLVKPSSPTPTAGIPSVANDLKAQRLAAALSKPAASPGSSNASPSSGATPAPLDLSKAGGAAPPALASPSSAGAASPPTIPSRPPQLPSRPAAGALSPRQPAAAPVEPSVPSAAKPQYVPGTPPPVAGGASPGTVIWGAGNGAGASPAPVQPVFRAIKTINSSYVPKVHVPASAGKGPSQAAAAFMAASSGQPPANIPAVPGGGQAPGFAGPGMGAGRGRAAPARGAPPPLPSRQSPSYNKLAQAQMAVPEVGSPQPDGEMEGAAQGPVPVPPPRVRPGGGAGGPGAGAAPEVAQFCPQCGTRRMSMASRFCAGCGSQFS